jgi:branched-chain amino acid transport system substrate-binding protein
VRFHRRVTASLMTPVLLLGGLSACSSDGPAGSGDTLVIGADLDNSSVVDIAYARALQLRIDQVNASGQLGNKKLALRTQDNRSDPTSSLRNISSFGDDKSVVAVVAGDCDECAVGAAKTIDDKKIPTIVLAPSDEVASPVAQRRYLFKLGPNSADSTAALVAELTRTRTTKKVGIVYADDLYGRGSEKALTAELSKTSIKVQASLSIKPTASDISQTIGTLTDGQPDALLVLTGPDQAQLAATSAKAAGFKGHLYFDAAAASNQFIAPTAVDATDNASMIFTQTLAIDDVIATTPAKAARKQWFRDYTSRYGDYSGVASFAADAVDLIAAAVARVGSDRDRIRDIVETSQLDGLAGPLRFTPASHSGLMPQALTMLVARSGRWRLAS